MTSRRSLPVPDDLAGPTPAELRAIRDARRMNSDRLVQLTFDMALRFEVVPTEASDPQVTTQVTLRHIPGNGYVISEICVSPAPDSDAPVDPTELRRLPVTTWVQDHVLEYLTKQHAIPGGVAMSDAPVNPSFADDGPTEDALRVFAGLYQAAVIAHVAPVKFLCEYLGFGRPKAANWVKRARAAGFLAPTTERKAGG